MNSGIAKVFSGLGKLLALVLCVASTLAIFDETSLWFELLSHFRFQYLVLSAVCLGVALLKRNGLVGLMCAVVVLHNAVVVLPWYLKGSDAPLRDISSIRIIQSNVLAENTNHQRFIDQIRASSADIISVQEVNSEWANSLEELNDEYPFRVLLPREDNFGLAVLSKIPIDEQSIIDLAQSGIPSIKISVNLQGRKITLIAVHTVPPISKDYFKLRNAQLRDLANTASRIDNPIIVMGDLNITLWSSYYTSFTKEASLVNARSGFGVLPTWPTSIPFMPIPIDHILMSEELIALEAHVGEDIGSDHYPFIAELGLK